MVIIMGKDRFCSTHARDTSPNTHKPLFLKKKKKIICIIF